MNVKKNNFLKKGFTLIELLVVIAIISMLASVVMYSSSSSRAKARDIQRVAALDSIKKAMELYRAEHGRYPGTFANSVYHPAGTYAFSFKYDVILGRASQQFNCTTPNVRLPTGTSLLRFDNSASNPGINFVELGLHPRFMNVVSWQDPINPSLSSLYNCRLVLPKAEMDTNNVQHYYAHCNLEVMTQLEEIDGGTNPTLYEINGGGTWITACGTYDDDPDPTQGE